MSGWAVGGVVFAATMMLVVGTFQILAGLVALLDDEFYVVGRDYTFKFDVTAWGWIHLLLGILLVVCGWALFARSAWAGVTAIVLAGFSAIASFLFIPYYPFWSLAIIAVDVFIIWALATQARAFRL